MGLCGNGLRQTRKLKKEGNLATPGSYSREGLRKETEKRVAKFYERDLFYSVQIKKISLRSRKWIALKKKAQRRIILGSISKLNDYFQPEFPSLKTGFSTFAFLRPKWYMPVAVPDHRICVSALNASNCQPISQIIMMY